MKGFKYCGAFIIPLLGLLTFYSTGIMAYLGLFILYVVIPILEYIIPENSINLEKAEKELTRENIIYDLILYIMVPLHLLVVYVFLTTISSNTLTLSDLIAYVLSMGTILGIVGINVGHELGHKTKEPLKMFLAHVLLTTSVQNHFVTYHNSGHHKDIGTPEDLTSAKEGDNFYFFGLKSQIGGYFKTWKLESKKLKSRGKAWYWNPMIIYTLLPVSLFTIIYLLFDPTTMLTYLVAGIYGISVLEAQNYFAHYGLRRKKNKNGVYEKVAPKHSWNSDHIIGRVLLFELTRHSDHHHMGAKPFQILDSADDSPLLPFGYPMMLILSYFPFIFKPVMKKRLKLYGIK